jgi:hypothetical protein
MSQNAANRRGKPGRTGYIGVSVRRGLFEARLTVDGRYIERRGFATAVEAAQCRDDLARVHHGEFAILNFPDEAAE